MKSGIREGFTAYLVAQLHLRIDCESREERHTAGDGDVCRSARDGTCPDESPLTLSKGYRKSRQCTLYLCGRVRTVRERPEIVGTVHTVQFSPDIVEIHTLIWCECSSCDRCDCP